ncbi:MAG TPA: hypothetical protein VFP65_07240 [Anaeromyxobacteraceae bacterium]|nr:hypothetical protein [Anaeromyxobacteraceae bacterium]
MKLLERLWPARHAPQAALLEAPGNEVVESCPGVERYEGNPQLAVIESYALDVIGELSPEEVEETEHAVVGLYGESTDWRHAVRRKLGWNPLMDAVIADNWHRFRSASRKAGEEVEPAEFARRFADEVVRLSRQ